MPERHPAKFASSSNGGGIRRRLVFGLLASAAGTCLTGAWAAPVTAAGLGRTRKATLTAFLDTLLPRDEFSGSASDLGVPASILAESATDPLRGRLIRVGCRWLDLAAGARFTTLDADTQEKIVTWAAGSDWDRVPRRFYEILRQRAVELYYSRPQAWAGLPISRPPQPLGYPEPWK